MPEGLTIEEARKRAQALGLHIRLGVNRSTPASAGRITSIEFRQAELTTAERFDAAEDLASTAIGKRYPAWRLTDDSIIYTVPPVYDAHADSRPGAAVPGAV